MSTTEWQVMSKQEQAEPFPTTFMEEFRWEGHSGGLLSNYVLKAGLISNTEQAAQDHNNFLQGWRSQGQPCSSHAEPEQGVCNPSAPPTSMENSS